MLIYVRLEQIEDNPFQKRVSYDEIEELANDIVNHQEARPDTMGLQQVPGGRLIFRNAREPKGRVIDNMAISGIAQSGQVLPNDLSLICQLEFGHRRLRAFRHLAQSNEAYTVMPVQIRALTDDQMLDGVWSENRQRRNLSAVEEAELLKEKLGRLQANGKGSQRELAEGWGLARPTVANRLSLLELPEEVKAANRDGRLSERQCLALKPIIRLDEIVNATKGINLNWGQHGTIRTSWPPLQPGVAIAQIVEAREDFTSDQIRKYLHQAFQFAGKQLPKTLATNDLACEEGIQQSTCRGCPMRIDDFCLNSVCLDKKMLVFGRRVAMAAAAELGVKYSEAKADFKPFLSYNVESRQKLLAVFNSGQRDNVVVGYEFSDGPAVRPLVDPPTKYMGDDLWDNDGAGVVILGHRGPITSEMLEPDQGPDIPDSATVESWKRAALVASTRAAQQGVIVIADFLENKLPEAAIDTLQTILCAETETHTQGEFLEGLVNILILSSDDFRQKSTAAAAESWHNLLKRVGLDDDILWGSKIERFEVLAADALSDWYSARWITWTRRYIEEARERIPPLLAAIGQLSPESEWIIELERALRDIDLAEKEFNPVG